MWLMCTCETFAEIVLSTCLRSWIKEWRHGIYLRSPSGKISKSFYFMFSCTLCGTFSRSRSPNKCHKWLTVQDFTWGTAVNYYPFQLKYVNLGQKPLETPAGIILLSIPLKCLFYCAVTKERTNI